MLCSLANPLVCTERSRLLKYLPQLSSMELCPTLDAMNEQDVRLISNLSLVDLQDHLSITPTRRPVLGFDHTSANTVDGSITAALDIMSKAAFSLWPSLWGEDWSGLRADALNMAHLPLRAAALSNQVRGLLPAWVEAAICRLLNNEQPLVPNVAAEVNWAQLTLAVSPDGLILAVPHEDNEMATDRIQALEWLSRHGRVAILVLTTGVPRHPAFDRVSYGARQFICSSSRSAEHRVSANDVASELSPIVLVLPEPPEGKPHPMSAIEQMLYRLIQSDEELRPLFFFNKTVTGLSLLAPKVDMLWSKGQVVVEIDGSDHRGAVKYRADRHRDYELMCAGYRVLRLTNEEVATDAALAIEKIRRVTRLAKEERA